jgi:hypothetical protein
MSLRGPKGRGNLLHNRRKDSPLPLRLLRFARNDPRQLVSNDKPQNFQYDLPLIESRVASGTVIQTL